MRKEKCHVAMWSGGGSKMVSLPIGSFEELKAASKQHFPVLWTAEEKSEDNDENEVRFYYIPDNTDLNSRLRIVDDDSFADFSVLTSRPTVFLYLWSTSGGSPFNMPSRPGSVSVDHSRHTGDASTRGHLQAKFRDAVLIRDGNACVVTNARIKRGSNNVHAAHIIGVADVKNHSLQILNAYDTCNGILLSTQWHTGFDNFEWCMDGEGVIHIHDDFAQSALYKNFAGKNAGKKIRPPEDVGLLEHWPTVRMLSLRFKVFEKNGK
jgi:hypothetical protein